jgi:hypothetical protein
MDTQAKRRWYERCGMCDRAVRVEHLTRVSWEDGADSFPLSGPVCGACWIHMPGYVKIFTPAGVERRLRIVSRAY